MRAQAGAVRLSAARESVVAAELDVALVCGSGRHHFIGANLAWWFSGVRQLGRDMVVAVPAEGEPVLVVAPRWDAQRAARRSWVSDVVAVDDVACALGGLLRSRGWKRVGVAGRDAASPALAAALWEARDVVLPTGHDEWSLACIERAVEIAEAGYRQLLATARPGLREYVVAAEADAHMRELGADDNFLLISASQHNRAVHAPTDRMLERGDVLLGEISPSVDGQFAQICRSATIGEPDARVERAYDILREAYDAGLAAAGPGVPVPEVAAAVNAVVASYGYERYTRPPYMRTRGHGTGLAPLVPADVSDRSDVVLAPGMAFVLHPNQYFPDAGYLLYGEHVVIEPDGARALSAGPASIESTDAWVAA
jgi:Xaa-Pro aminopeptidase